MQSLRIPALLRTLALGALALASCTPRVRERAAEPKPAPRWQIPVGCEQNLSGEYAHAENPNFRYRGRDDGGTLVLDVERAATDGGVSGSTAPTIRLVRSREGFAGTTSARVYDSRGTLCDVEFPTALVACDDAGLLLRAQTTAAVDEACRPPPERGPAPMTDQRLVRTTTRVTGADAGQP